MEGFRLKNDLKAFLAKKLKPQELALLYRSYDIIGDIAVIRVPEDLKSRRKLTAAAIMQVHKQVKTVLCQTGSVQGEFRLRGLEWVAGERKTETVYREYGCLFRVDLVKCFFSPRLSFERMRIARQVQPGEAVVNMFAGVGSYSILIAKHSQASKVYSIDLNPDAVNYMLENIGLNGVQNRVVAIRGDAKDVIREKLKGAANRVLMPLPEKAYEYLDYALLALHPEGGWIHYYAFEHAKKSENPVEKTEIKVVEKLEGLEVNFDIASHRIVRTTGPNWYQTVIDIRIQSRNAVLNCSKT